MKKYKLFLLIISVFFLERGEGQVVDSMLMVHQGVCNDKGYCIPKVPGIRKPRGLTVNYLNALNYGITSSTADSVYSGIVNRDRRLKMKLKVPIIMHDNFKFILGLKYGEEEYSFNNESTTLSFHKALNKKLLRTAGLSGYFITPFKGNKYLISILNTRLSGDFDNGEPTDYFRVSASSLFGKRSSSTVSWGLGINYSYTFGRQTIFPLFAYSNKFSDQWSFEAVLPINFRFRYQLSKKDIFELMSRARGDSYNISLENYQTESLYLQGADILSGVSYEREIYDFIWVSFGGGYRHNISFDLFEQNTFNQRANPKIDNKLAGSLYFDLGIFLVPPKKISR